jgi:hypothetical protein
MHSQRFTTIEFQLFLCYALYEETGGENETNTVRNRHQCDYAL